MYEGWIVNGVLFLINVILWKINSSKNESKNESNKEITLSDDEFRLPDSKNLMGGVFSIFDRADDVIEKVTTFYCQQKIVLGNKTFNRTVILEAHNEYALKSGDYIVFDSENKWRLIDNKFPDIEYKKIKGR